MENEPFEHQGKRKDQVESSMQGCVVTFLAIVAAVAIYTIVKFIGI